MKCISSILVVCFLFSNFNDVQAQNEYRIEGELTGLKDSTRLYLIRNRDERGPDTVSRAYSTRDKFNFKGRIPFEGEVYFIKIDTSSVKYDSAIDGYIILLLENKQISIKGSVYKLLRNDIAITGSPSYDDYILYMHGEDSMNNTVNDLKKKAALANQKDTALVNNITFRIQVATLDRQKYTSTWIEEHPGSLWTPKLISIWIQDMESKIIAYGKLSSVAKKSKYGTLIKEDIDNESNLRIGMIAPNFTCTTVDGNNISLNEIVPKAKYTIIDFWASWCLPCREELPFIKLLYNKYHSSGLNVLGYSVDENENQWKGAIIKDSLPWYNVRETKKDVANKLYHVDALPTVYILGNTGEIVGRKLTLEALEKKIDELMDKK